MLTSRTGPQNRQARVTHIDPTPPPEVPPFEPNVPDIAPPATPGPEIPPVGPDHPDVMPGETPPEIPPSPVQRSGGS